MRSVSDFEVPLNPSETPATARPGGEKGCTWWRQSSTENQLFQRKRGVEQLTERLGLKGATALYQVDDIG